MNRPVVVLAYQAHWVDEFARIAKDIRRVVGSAAVRIDHIGSTAVPGLGAKDVIDIQITVSDLDAVDGLTNRLRAAGFRQGAALESDVVHGKPAADPEFESASCESRRASGGSTSTSGSAGSTSGTRCCFATICARQTRFAPRTRS